VILRDVARAPAPPRPHRRSPRRGPPLPRRRKPLLQGPPPLR
jgi:hypothetical protein